MSCRFERSDVIVEIGPITVTTDADEFEDELSYLYVQGGGDCPEMSIGAIQKALEESLPRSYIYVFTDARAKDYHLTDKVIELIQRKQSQVVFVMTGDCGDNTHEGFVSYLKIASTSSGQVFLLKKHQVNEVHGTDERGFPFIRSSKSAISAVVPEPPVVTVAPKSIDCVVETKVAYEVKWYKVSPYSGRNISMPALMYLPNSSLSIPNVEENNEGWYICVAENIGGQSSERTFLKVGAAPKVSLSPKQIDFVTGGVTRIECSATGSPPAAISWRHRGRTLAAGSRVDIDGGSLVLRDMTRSDAGVYECVANNIAGTETAASDVRFIEKPFIRLEKDSMLVAKGDPAALVCSATGIPPPAITWYKNNREINKGNAYVRVTSSGDLMLLGVQPEDAADYTCVARNKAGEDRAVIRLEVGSVPVISEAPRSAQVDIQTDYTMPCTASGYPTPNITWRKDNQPISDPNVFVDVNNSLHIKETSKDNEGSYACTALNQFGSHQVSASVVVTGIISPVIGFISSLVELKVGETLFLQCVVVMGNPKPTITWYKNAEVMLAVPGKVLLSPGGSLTVTDVDLSDEGEYMCTASNIGGTATMHTRLDVRGNPISLSDPHYYINLNNDLEIFVTEPADTAEYACNAKNSVGDDTKTISLVIREPPAITEFGLSLYTVVSGDPVTLVCQAAGKPTPVIKWQKNGNFLTTEDFAQGLTILADGSLRLSSAQISDEGLYSCVARNEAGFSQKSIQLNVFEPPKWPTDFNFNPKDINVIQGFGAKLLCPAQGSPPPRIIWSKDGAVLTGNELGIILNDDGSLDIPIAQVSDSGRYTCRAVNDAGDVSLDIEFSVYVPPSFGTSGTVQETDVTVVVNSTLILECSVQAIPPPDITWYKNGEEFVLNEDRMTLKKNDQMLTITGVQLLDEGRYKCVAENRAGEDERITDVTVQGKWNLFFTLISLFVVPPSIKEPPLSSKNNLTTVQSRNIYIECHAEGKPTPDISWYKDGLLLESSTEALILDSGRRLHLTQPSADSEGSYQCVAENVVGVAERSFQMNVYRWHRNGHSKKSLLWNSECGPQVDIANATLNDTATYACRARNQAEEWLRHRLTVYEPPSILDSDMVTALEVLVNSSITIHCDAEGIPHPSEVAEQRTTHLLYRLKFQVLRLTVCAFVTESSLEAAPTWRVSADGYGLTLLIANVGHTARYTCIATNEAGSADKDFDLDVLV
ncbi:HMCN1 [Bugula neritina]|uniref:HMCN1 n=1 Tax=Bugula neritina TaxID=10212 RepID=A0A7J7K059_BUGNE|nr:HMCN1 [Bugula neritina]